MSLIVARRVELLDRLVDDRCIIHSKRFGRATSVFSSSFGIRLLLLRQRAPRKETQHAAQYVEHPARISYH